MIMFYDFFKNHMILLCSEVICLSFELSNRMFCGDLKYIDWLQLIACVPTDSYPRRYSAWFILASNSTLCVCLRLNKKQTPWPFELNYRWKQIWPLWWAPPPFSRPFYLLLLLLVIASAAARPHHFTCEAGEFQCDDGICVSGYKQCNGIVDCLDESDEIDCPTTSPFYDGITTRCVWNKFFFYLNPN